MRAIWPLWLLVVLVSMDTPLTDMLWGGPEIDTAYAFHVWAVWKVLLCGSFLLILGALAQSFIAGQRPWPWLAIAGLGMYEMALNVGCSVWWAAWPQRPEVGKGICHILTGVPLSKFTLAAAAGLAIVLGLGVLRGRHA